MAESGLETTNAGLRLCDFIQARRQEILAEWERRARAYPVARHLSSPVLRDHVPRLLERIVHLVRSVHTGRNETLGELPDRHALERLEAGYDLHTAARELGDLRDTILELWEREAAGAITIQEVRRLDQAIDEILATSVDRFARARERTLRALERVASVPFGSGDLDSFLHQLMSVVLETVAAVDSVVLLLEGEHGMLHARVALGVEEALGGGFSVRVGEGFAGRVAQQREPLLLRDASTDPWVLSAAFRRQGIHALYGVPLVHEGGVIGVVHMGSRTAYEFSDDDQQLLRTLAQRATASIVQAQLTERLRRSEARLQAIVDTAVDGIITIDERGAILGVNPATTHLFGYTPEELVGRDVSMLMPEPDRGQHDTYMRNYLRTGVRKVIGIGREALGQRKDGSVFPLELSVSETLLPGARFFTGMVRDITRRKTAQQAQALLVEAGRLLTQSLDVRSTLHSLASLAVAHLADYCMVDLLGEDGQLHRHEVQAKAPQRQEVMKRLMAYPPRVGSRSPTARVLETGRVTVADVSPEWLDAVARDATHRALLEELAPRSSVLVPLIARGRKLGVLNLASTTPGRMSDPVMVEAAQGVADRAAIAIDNARLYGEAQEAVRVREDVMAIVSHDLRNPLNAISLASLSLLRHDPLTEAQGRGLRRIVAAADRAHRMIRDLLDFTQARAGGAIPIHPRPVDLHELTRQVVDEVHLANPGRHVTVEARGDGHGEWDEDRLAQVITNLVGNALQHSPEGSQVRVSSRSEGDGVVLSVHNAGSPIPAALLPVIFEPYRRGPAAALGRGSIGLGLYITRQIVLGHGGHIDVRSSQEEGTTFTVWLPRKTAAVVQ